MMSEQIEQTNPILWLIERKIFQKEQKQAEVTRPKELKLKKKEEKKRVEQVRVAVTDKHIMQRVVYGHPYPGDEESYPRLIEEGFMARVALEGRPIYGLTPKGVNAIGDYD